MLCPNCAKKIDDDSKFCVHCGVSVVEIEKDKEASESLQSNSAEVSIDSYEERNAEIFVRKRHKTVRGLVRFSNFFGWLFVITILFLPLGLLLLLNGHLVLASLETEHNTKETTAIMTELLKRS